MRLRRYRLRISGLRTRVAHLCVVSAYQQAEEFLQQFKYEHPNSSPWKCEQRFSLMGNVLRNIGPGYAATVKIVGKLEIDIFDYYREVRNRFLRVKPKGAQDATGL